MFLINLPKKDNYNLPGANKLISTYSGHPGDGGIDSFLFFFPSSTTSISIVQVVLTKVLSISVREEFTFETSIRDIQKERF